MIRTLFIILVFYFTALSTVFAEPPPISGVQYCNIITESMEKCNVNKYLYNKVKSTCDQHMHSVKDFGDMTIILLNNIGTEARNDGSPEMICYENELEKRFHKFVSE